VSVIHQFDLDGESPWVISSEGGFPHATLLNEGNAPTTISLNVRSVPTGWTVTGDTTIVLSVGEIRGIPIQIIPDMNWNGETYTIKIEAIDELGNVDEILLDTTKQDYSWASSPIISAVNGDNVLLKIHGTNSQTLVLDGSQGLLEWDSREGWLWPAFQSISDGEITINSEEGLVYTSYVSMPSIRDGFCTLNNDPNNILASCSISNGTGDYDYTLLLIDDKGKLIDSLSGTLGDNMSLDNANLSAINWAPEPGIRTLILRAMDSRGIEFASISIDYEIIRSDWNIGLTGIELIGTGKNQQIQITTIRENQNLLSEADCLLTVESDDYIGEHIIDPSGVYLLPKIDRPPIPDGSELVIQFNCAFPWNVESNLNDNEVRIILTGGKDTDEGIQDFETGLASALLVIGLASALAWLVKNHRERKEMMQITEKAIMQHLSKKNKSPIVTEEVKEEEEEIENTTSLEKDEKELNAQNEVEEVIEEELDEFELRLRRLGKL
jgi:hypothetical protein